MAENTNIVLTSSGQCKTSLGVQAKMTASATIQYYRDGYDLKVVLKARSHSLSGNSSGAIDKGANWICYQFDNDPLPSATSSTQGIQLGRSSYIKDNGSSGSSQYTAVDTVWTIKNIGTAARTITFYLYTWVGYDQGSSSTSSSNNNYNTRGGDVVAQNIPALPLPEIFPPILTRGIYQKLSGRLHYADKMYIPINDAPKEIIGGWVKENGVIHQFWPPNTLTYTVSLYGVPDEVIWYSTGDIISDSSLPYWQIQLDSDGRYDLTLTPPPSGSAYYFKSVTFENCTLTLSELTMDKILYLWPGVVFYGGWTTTAPTGVTFGEEVGLGEKHTYKANSYNWYARAYASGGYRNTTGRPEYWVKFRVQAKKASGWVDQGWNYTVSGTYTGDLIGIQSGTNSHYCSGTASSASYSNKYTGYLCYWGGEELFTELRSAAPKGVNTQTLLLTPPTE